MPDNFKSRLNKRNLSSPLSVSPTTQHQEIPNTPKPLQINVDLYMHPSGVSSAMMEWNVRPHPGSRDHRLCLWMMPYILYTPSILYALLDTFRAYILHSFCYVHPIHHFHLYTPSHPHIYQPYSFTFCSTIANSTYSVTRKSNSTIKKESRQRSQNGFLLQPFNTPIISFSV